MKEVEYIIGIYNNFNPFPENPDQMGYYFLYLLDHKGILEPEDAKQIYLEKANLHEANDALKLGYVGPFESLDSLNQFAFYLCEKLNAEKISLVSVHDYNNLIETSTSADTFQQSLIEKGNIIQNIERKKKGFLSRIFN